MLGMGSRLRTEVVNSGENRKLADNKSKYYFSNTSTIH